MEQNFYSNGKLLLTGEYVVLDGAKALAVPTKFGQSLKIKQGSNKQFKWTSFDVDKSIWFEDVIAFNDINPSARVHFLIQSLHSFAWSGRRRGRRRQACCGHGHRYRCRNDGRE